MARLPTDTADRQQVYIGDDAYAFPTIAGGGGLFGGEPSPGSGPLDGEATAEWLQLQVTPPGREPEVAKRTIFDRLPADLRASGQLTSSAIAPIDLVDFKGTGSADYLPMLGLEKFGDRNRPDRRCIRRAGRRCARQVRLRVPRPAGRDRCTGRDRRRRPHCSTTDRTSSPSWSHRRPIFEGRRRCGARHLVALPRRSAAQRLDAERRSVPPGRGRHGPRGGALCGGQPIEHIGGSKTTIGVSDVFQAAAGEGIPTIVLNGAPPASLPYDPTASALIENALASGEVVVVPAKPVTIGGTPRVGGGRSIPRPAPRPT